jgi:hypothetical protein
MSEYSVKLPFQNFEAHNVHIQENHDSKVFLISYNV